MFNKNITTSARAADRIGCNTLRFNYRGVGRSAGVYGNIRGECDDAAAVLAWLKATYAVKELWWLGFSFGAYVACKLAEARVILIAPSIANMPFAEIQPLPRPLFVIQGEADEVIDYPAVCRWVTEQGLEAHFARYPGVGHFFHGQQGVLAQAVQQMLTGTWHA